MTSNESEEVVIVVDGNHSRLPNSYDGIHEIRWYNAALQPATYSEPSPAISYYYGTLKEYQSIICLFWLDTPQNFYLKELSEGDDLDHPITYWGWVSPNGEPAGLKRYRWKAVRDTIIAVVEDDDDATGSEQAEDSDNDCDYDEDYYERAYRAATGNPSW